MLIPGVQAAKPQKVTLMVDDVPVAQVLQALAEQEKLNLVVSPDVSGTVSLHLTDVCNQVNHLIPTRVLVKGGEITCKILK